MTTRALVITLILILSLAPMAAVAQVVHTVNQVGFTFDPADLTIKVGDTVRWMHSAGTHTVTSGTGAADPQVGSLFDTPLSAAAPMVEFVFTQIGDVLYFCRPHEGLNMKAIIRVEADATPAPTPSLSLLRMQSIQPNPFNPRALVRFELGSAGLVTITIHDARGRLVRRLTDASYMEPGEQQVIWDGRDGGGLLSPSGVYHFRVRTPGAEQSLSGVLVR